MKIKINSIASLFFIFLFLFLLFNFIFQQFFGSIELINQAFIISILYIALLIYLKLKRVAFKINIVSIIIGCYSLWLIITTLILDVSLLDSILLMIFQLFLFFIIYPMMEFKNDEMFKVFWFLAIIGVSISIIFLIKNYELFLNLLQGQNILYNYISPVFGNKNADANFIFFGFVSLVILYKSNKKKIFYLMLPITLLALLLTFSRSVYVAAFIFVVIFTAFNSSFKKNILKLSLLVPISLILYSNEFIKYNFLKVDRGLSGREYLWDNAWSLIQENWMFGIGIGQWKYYSGLEISPHNSYLKVLVEFGLVGLLLYLLFIITLICIGIRKYKKCNEHNTKIISAGLTAFLIAMSIKLYFETTIIGDDNIFAVYFTMISSMIVILKNNKVN